MDQFKEEADDLNISITDDQLKKYIIRFDQIKNSPKVTEKDLRKYSLSQLIRLVTASKGVADEEEDQTPDVVYQDNGITIWNGSKENNCIMYGRGESWCITRGSYSNYRYNENKGYPTFYLAKNSNLSDSDPLSFVAIQVRDTPNENERYVYTNRKNSPYESKPMNFSGLMSEIPWLRDIPNIKNILKYIPLSSTEKANKVYGNKTISVREWTKLPYQTKQQYLVVKSRGKLFNDITNSTFVSKYLPEYPQLANFIAQTPNVVDPLILLKNLESFNNQDRRSITANLRDKVDLDYLLPTDEVSFDVKKLLTTLDKWDLPNYIKLYVTKDGSTIVKLDLRDGNIKMGLYQAQDDYPNVKLNKRTVKYLLDYPKISEIPFANMVKLMSDDILDLDFIKSLIQDVYTKPGSSIVVKEVNGRELLIDSNTLTAYELKDGKVNKIPFEDEDVQTAFSEQTNNEGFQENIINLIKSEEPFPAGMDYSTLQSIIDKIPYDKRTYTDESNNTRTILASNDQEDNFIFTYPLANSSDRNYLTSIRRYRDSGRPYSTYPPKSSVTSILNYLRSQNLTINDESLIKTLNETSANSDTKNFFLASNPPLDDTNTLRIVMSGETPIIYKTTDLSANYKVSPSRSGLVKAQLTPAAINRLVRANAPEAPEAPETPETPETPAAQAGPRRGRPAGATANTQLAAPAGGENNRLLTTLRNANLTTGFNTLPVSIINKLISEEGTTASIYNSKGATRRNRLLGNAGRVVAIVDVGPNSVYFIRLNDDSYIASIAVGTNHYLVTPTNSVKLNSPSDLLAALRQRNLAEVRHYVVNEYLERNPDHLEEFKNLFRQALKKK
jgi:hypothetical protein